ncbi:hypothetical protein PX554_20960 [Sphingomonas sp. H39-1-10]|uniref:hypothetical protein n=1 Tax=Sphingomonas pollutisoli TaxID=3030829 RepID=UPI0023B96230|nr:hypothetical protein [Sphingomonas pollutisoli]MDF0490607.1 hypothetical protein [Sphingomonas pollutisoli]
MQIPEPVPGLVIRYAYLWSHEAKVGHEEGSEDRPCAVLLPASLYETIRQRWLAAYDAGRIAQVKRAS